METGNKTIVESSWDEVWGTGKHIGSKDALNKNKWTSNGLLGKILMGIRDKQLEPYLFGENEPTSEIPMSTEVNTNYVYLWKQLSLLLHYVMYWYLWKH